MERESNEIKTMRAIEWERAKGSIRAVLASMWDAGQDKFTELDEMADEFMTKFGEEAGID